MIILDTNVISALRRLERVPTLVEWLHLQNGQELLISVISIGEIERGISLQELKNPQFAQDLRHWLARVSTDFSENIVNFDGNSARIWGQLSAKIGNKGADLQIAATALSIGAKVATANVSDFEPTGVEVINPLG